MSHPQPSAPQARPDRKAERVNDLPNDRALPTCLLAVDVQNGLLGGAAAQLPERIKSFCETVPSVSRRLFVRFVQPPAGAALPTLRPDMEDGTDDAELPAVVAGVPQIVADRHDEWLCGAHGLSTALSVACGPEKGVAIVGADSYGAVVNAALEMQMTGFDAWVVSDLVASQDDEELGDSARESLSAALGAHKIVTSQEFARLAGPPDSPSALPPLLRTWQDCLLERARRVHVGASEPGQWSAETDGRRMGDDGDWKQLPLTR